MADLSDQVDSEYEEDGLNDEMWNEMNDVLQEVVLSIKYLEPYLKTLCYNLGFDASDYMESRNRENKDSH